MTDKHVAFTLIILASVLLPGCSGRPSGVLSKEDMAQLMADIHTGESVIDNSSSAFPTDSSRRAFLQAIYARHGIDRAQVDSSFSWYGAHLEKYIDVCDRTVEILEQRLENAQDIAGTSADGAVEVNVNLQGDSVDVWPGMRWRRFSASMPNDHITFSLASDRNWERGDVYTLRAKALGNNQPFTYILTVEYADGREEYVTSQQSADGWHQVQLVLDSARNAQRVYGIVSYPSRRNETVFIDSITLMRTRWGGHYREQRNAVKNFNNKSRPGSMSSGVTTQPVAPQPTADKPLRFAPDDRIRHVELKTSPSAAPSPATPEKR